MRYHLLALAILLALVSTSFSDSPPRPDPLVFTSDYGSDVLFTMVPAQHDKEKDVIKPAFGVAYRVGKDGKFTELYRTTNWYSFEVHISVDGKHLVQMGPWNIGSGPSTNHLAIAFHKDGKPLKSYSTAELIKDPKQVEVSTSHYRWQAPSSRIKLTADQVLQLQPKLSYDDKFTLHTIEGWTYVFDVTTGAIVSTNKTKL